MTATDRDRGVAIFSRPHKENSTARSLFERFLRVGSEIEMRPLSRMVLIEVTEGGGGVE